MDIPMVGTIHQLPWFVSAYLPDLPILKNGVESIIWSCSRWLNGQFDELVVPTPTIARTIQAEAGFKPLDISNGVDLSHFTQERSRSDEKEDLCQKYKLDPDRPIILHVGRLDCDKRVDKVIEAAAKTLRMTNAQMLIVGDGECKEALQNQARSLGIWENCHFPGFISAKGDLPGIYRMADVFTTASEIETQGLVLLEALASGLPVVAVEATCIPELVHDTINGFLHQPNDVDAFADSLTFLIENPVQAKQMGQVGRGLAEKHSIQAALNQHENLYQITIAQHRKAMHVTRKRAWTFN
jgi:glycosyltransferase involved in cell wall biosynthesis